MSTYKRTPEWNVVIRRPDYSKICLGSSDQVLYKRVSEWSKNGVPTDKLRFVSSESLAGGAFEYTDLIGYEYDNSLKNVSNPFSLTITPAQDKVGLSWKDKIKSSDVVFISEFGKLRFIGIVGGTSYSMNLNNENPNRSVTISGTSFGGKLESFNIPMNIYLWYTLGTTADQKNTAFMAALNSKVSEKQSLKDIFTSIKDGFFEVAFGANQDGFLSLMTRYFQLDIDNLVAFYPLNLKPYQRDSNTLWSIFRQILPEPVYEIFGRFEKGKYHLICRETPFDAREWGELTITTLNPLYLLEQNLNDSDDEVYTHYFSQLPNSAFSQNEIYANQSLSDVSIFDKDKLKIYGYRQLQANFPFYDIDKGREFNSQDFLKKNSARMYAWYTNNVDFQSGTITMMTVPEGENNEYINIGERIKYLEGAASSIEFYVEGVTRKMTYPQTMTSKYSVTRGYEYGLKSVKIEGITLGTPQVKKISQLGRKLLQAEQDITGRT